MAAGRAPAAEVMLDITTFPVVVGDSFASFTEFHDFEPVKWEAPALGRLFAGLRQFVIQPMLFRWLNDPLLNCAPDDHPGRAIAESGSSTAEVLVCADKLVARAVDSVSDEHTTITENLGSMLGFLRQELVQHLTGPVADDLRKHKDAGAVVVLERLAAHWGYFQKVVKLFATMIYRPLDLGIKLSSCADTLPRTSPIAFRCFTELFREFGRGLVEPCIELMNRRRDGAECDLTPVRNVADMLLCISLANLNNKAEYTRFIKGSRRVRLERGIAYFDEFHEPVLDAARLYFRRRAAEQNTVAVPEAMDEVFGLLNRERAEIGAWVHTATGALMLRIAQAEMLVGPDTSLEAGDPIVDKETATVCTRVCDDMARLLSSTQTEQVHRIYQLYKGLPVNDYLKRVAQAYRDYVYSVGEVIVNELRSKPRPDRKNEADWVDGMVQASREAYRWCSTEEAVPGAFCDGPPSSLEPHKLFKSAMDGAIEDLIVRTNARVEENRRLHTEGRTERMLTVQLDKMLRASGTEALQRVTLKRATLVASATEKYTLGDVLEGLVARVHTADSLMEWYQTKLAERILSDGVKNSDAEKEVLAWLKLNFSNCEKAVSKCFTMWVDVYGDAAKEFAELYDEAMKKAVGGEGAVGVGGGVVPPIDPSLNGVPEKVTVKLLTQANWPPGAFVESQTRPRLTLGVSRGLEAVMAHFTAWYATQGSSKKCLFYTSAGSLTFTVRRIGHSSQVFKGSVTTPQAVVMLLFNLRKRVTVRDVVHALRLEEGDEEGDSAPWKVVQRVIHPLVARQRQKDKGTPHFLRIEKGDGSKHSIKLSEIALDDVLSLNMNKKYFKRRGAYSPAAPPLKPERQSAAIQEQTERMREVQLKAAIVRIVKARRKIEINHLFPEVRTQLAGRFLPGIPQMKGSMNTLIKEGYLKRVDRKFIELLNVSGAGAPS